MWTSSSSSLSHSSSKVGGRKRALTGKDAAIPAGLSSDNVVSVGSIKVFSSEIELEKFTKALESSSRETIGEGIAGVFLGMYCLPILSVFAKLGHEICSISFTWIGF